MRARALPVGDNGNFQVSYACIYIFYLDFNKINELDLFDNLLNMPMLLCKGFTSNQQLWSYGDLVSV